jgi:hypothetical protein
MDESQMNSVQQSQEDDVLKRLLKTPPKPHPSLIPTSPGGGEGR